MTVKKQEDPIVEYHYTNYDLESDEYFEEFIEKHNVLHTPYNNQVIEGRCARIYAKSITSTIETSLP